MLSPAAARPLRPVPACHEARLQRPPGPDPPFALLVLCKMALSASTTALSASPGARVAAHARNPRRVACVRADTAASCAQGPVRRAAAGLAAAGLAAALVLTPPALAAPREAAAPLPPLPARLDIPYQQGGEAQFEPMAYTGRWYEVASLKKGFAGEGQADCHCTQMSLPSAACAAPAHSFCLEPSASEQNPTLSPYRLLLLPESSRRPPCCLQGIYVPLEDPEGAIRLQVNTFCVHGGPGGRLSGIQGSVSCADPAVLELLPEFKTEMDKMEGLVAKCALKFDSLPFIPAEPYVVIRTDYTTYALVRGAKDRSFVQVYSRTPNPGPEFIAAQKATLAELGYPVQEIVDTPQDCPEMTADAMMARMNAGMEGAQLMPGSTPRAKAMRGYDLGELTPLVAPPGGGVTGEQAPVNGIAFDRFRNPLESLRNALSLFSSD
ncbi:hypothetical protein ABPG75_009129 [Micractinium tetrahymenae]